MNEIWGHLVFVMSVFQSVTLRLTNIIYTLAIPLTRRRLKTRSHALIYTRCVNYTYMYNLHRVHFCACERNCIYVKVNLHMCKYTPPCKYTSARTRCIFAFAYMYFIHICIFGHVNAQQIYTRMQM